MKNKIREWLIIAAMKTVIAGTVFGAMCSACACVEGFCGDSTEYTTKKVLYLGDFCKDAEGTTYNIDADYKYGDIISITLNPHGRVVGVNGRCFIQTLE